MKDRKIRREIVQCRRGYSSPQASLNYERRFRGQERELKVQLERSIYQSEYKRAA